MSIYSHNLAFSFDPWPLFLLLLSGGRFPLFDSIQSGVKVESLQVISVAWVTKEAAFYAIAIS